VYTAASGGVNQCGVILRVTPAGSQSLVYTFTGALDGCGPSGVALDAAGNLYGTTAQGGIAGLGAVFKIDPSGKETSFNAFSGGPSGSTPQSSLVRDDQGNIYGATSSGGTYNCGTLYRIDKSSQETVLYNFPGGNYGCNPSGNLARDAPGNIYGTTSSDDSECVVFKISPAGQETMVIDLGVGAGLSGVAIDAAGNLYGTGLGIVYKVEPAYGYRPFYTFTPGPGGYVPNGNVVLDAAGNVYGTTAEGGIDNQGVIFKISPSGAETVLYSFTGGADGFDPLAGVTLDSAGNIYGTTAGGGVAGGGTVFALTAAGVYTVLHSFPQNSILASPPFSSLAVDANGNIYGATLGVLDGCQTNGTCGTIYEIDAAGNYTLLHTFAGGRDGAMPAGPVLVDSYGTVFGTASAQGEYLGGVLFKLTPPQ
jgi:uncharacterized repeat protein (TIGR03803 family)